MRPRFLIFIFFAVLLVAALLFFRRPAQSSVKTVPLRAAVQTNSTPALGMNATHQNAPSVGQPMAPTNPTQAKVNDYYLAIGQKFVESKNRPIDFYGRVIDQDGNPLSGVDIKVSVETLVPVISTEGFVGSRYTRLEYISGADGRFEISGVGGDDGGIQVTKDGYVAESEKNGFGGGTSGSFENPVVFKMWNTNIHEKLITGKRVFQISPDGRPYFINLTDGKISESGTGDLKVWIKRPNEITYGTRYDWSCDVDIIDGGLQPASDYVMWMAPANGYVPSFHFEQSIGSGWGDSTGERRFYVTLNNGREYGNITIELYAYYNNQIPGLIRLSYIINPSGSRILR